VVEDISTLEGSKQVVVLCHGWTLPPFKSLGVVTSNILSNIHFKKLQDGLTSVYKCNARNKVTGGITMSIFLPWHSCG